MKYTYVCANCSYMTTVQLTLEEYEKSKGVPSSSSFCEGIGAKNGKHILVRVYFSPSVQYVGDGFTGAQGSLPHMDKAKRKEDLASDSGVDI